jgi:ribosomal protein L32
MKKRHRQMAGKALKDVKNLNTCPACGQIKRSHVLCQHCVGGTHNITPLSALLDINWSVLCRDKKAMGTKGSIGMNYCLRVAHNQ